MTTYEINVWEDKMVIEKVIRQFENDEAVTDYIQKRWDTEIKPRLDTEKGKLGPKAQDMIITWAKISTYIRKRGPSFPFSVSRRGDRKSTRLNSSH